MSDTRQTCTGDGFEHDETVMSIARATSEVLRLRCPICRREVHLQPDSNRSTPTPHPGRTPIQIHD